MKKFYPIFLDVAGKKAVVVGGGAVASRKAWTLLDAGADVTVISPALDPGLAALLERGRISHVPRSYAPGDLAGAFIAVAATDDPETNLDVAMEARESDILVNCAKPPGAGSFVVPSSIRRGDLTVAISTGGGCPALSKRLRLELEGYMGKEYGPFLSFLEDARAGLKQALPDENARRAVLEELAGSDLPKAFRNRAAGEAAELGKQMLKAAVERLKS